MSLLVVDFVLVVADHQWVVVKDGHSLWLKVCSEGGSRELVCRIAGQMRGGYWALRLAAMCMELGQQHQLAMGSG